MNILLIGARKMVVIESKESLSQDEKQFNRIIRAIFGLTPKQMLVFNQIRSCANQETCVLNLVKEMNSERSIIQKYIKVLMKKKLITRRSVTLNEFNQRCQRISREDISSSTNKGYLFLYTPITNEDLIARIQTTTENWIKIVKKTI